MTSRLRKVLQTVSWILVIGGILLWIAGAWYGALFFFVGLIVEGVGYFVAGHATRKRR